MKDCAALDTRRLRSFTKIVDIGSLSRAAGYLGIVQPALSNMIAAFEADFSAKLLVRSAQGVKPTEAGQRLYRHAQVILRQLEQAREDVRMTTAELSGTASIGLPLSSASVLSIPILQAARECIPGVRLQLRSLPSGLIMDQVLNGHLDLALMFSEGDVKGIGVRPLLAEELFFITAAGSSDVRQMDVAEFDAIAEAPLLLPSTPHAIRDIVEEAFQARQLKPNVIAEMDSLPSLRAAVRAGLGNTIMSWASVQVDGETNGLHLRRIAGPKLFRTISLCWSDIMPATAVTEAVRDLIVKVVDQVTASAMWIGVEAH